MSLVQMIKEIILGIKRLYYDIFNIAEHNQSSEITGMYGNAYQDLSSFSDAQLSEYIESLTRIRESGQTSDNERIQFSRQELAALHYSAISERNNRKKNRLAVYTIIVGVVMGIAHIVLN